MKFPPQSKGNWHVGKVCTMLIHLWKWKAIGQPSNIWELGLTTPSFICGAKLSYACILTKPL